MAGSLRELVVAQEVRRRVREGLLVGGVVVVVVEVDVAVVEVEVGGVEVGEGVEGCLFGG